MLNFTFYNPTRLEFGAGTIAELAHLVPENTPVLMTYGGGSIFKNGVYDQVKKALVKHNVIEFGGIEPNPHFETLMKAVQIVREKQIGFLLAVGGGSVLDGTKFIAAASCLAENEDPWGILTGSIDVKKAIPLGDVMTLPATGSEMNGGAVITRAETREKLCFGSDWVRPKFSIIDPAVTVTLPTRQTANGIVDTFTHICEQVMTYDVNSPVVDQMAFGVLRALVTEAPKVFADPANVEVRANLFWAATVGLNGFLGTGVAQDWSTHMIGHELTAEYGLDHGQTLAIVLPAVWRYHFAEKKVKLAAFGRVVFGISEASVDVAAEKAILQTEHFFNSCGVKTRLADYGIDAAQAADKVAERFAKRDVHYGEHADIDAEAARIIVRTC